LPGGPLPGRVRRARPPSPRRRLEVSASEKDVAGAFAGQPVKGYVDLAPEKDGRAALLDLKLSGAWYRRKELEEGRALQLALYASMMRDGGEAYPPAGYLILEDGQLLTTSPRAFPGATVVSGLNEHETLQAAEEGFGYWRRVPRRACCRSCPTSWSGKRRSRRRAVRFPTRMVPPGTSLPEDLFRSAATLPLPESQESSAPASAFLPACLRTKISRSTRVRSSGAFPPVSDAISSAIRFWTCVSKKLRDDAERLK
jgi:hypothetical protein